MQTVTATKSSPSKRDQQLLVEIIDGSKITSFCTKCWWQDFSFISTFCSRCKKILLPFGQRGNKENKNIRKWVWLRIWSVFSPLLWCPLHLVARWQTPLIFNRVSVWFKQVVLSSEQNLIYDSVFAVTLKLRGGTLEMTQYKSTMTAEALLSEAALGERNMRRI